MSTALSPDASPLALPAAADAAAPAATPPARTGAPAWLREPLLHFVLLGAALFVADHLLLSRSDDPRTIVMGAAVDQEARTTFKAARGRDPDAQELAALRQVWLDNEVLYREGLAMQLDRGDSAIRERVIFKALSTVDANVRPPAHDDAVLRTWFEARRAKYDEPARYDFEEAALNGDSSEGAVLAFVKELNAGSSGEAKAGLRIFKGRPHANLVLSYGDDFAKALEAAPPGQWRAYPTREGWRAVRLMATTPARPAQFEALRPVVLQDWTDTVMSEQRSAAVAALARKYKIVNEAAAR